MSEVQEKIEWWTVDTKVGDLKYIEDVLSRGFPNEGPITTELERYFESFLDVKHAILTTSGTIAIYLALKSLGIGPGDRVGVPNMTFIATANAVSLTGAEPILLEVDEETLCIDPVNLRHIHQVTPLKAVVPVHVSGRSALTPEMVSTLSDLNLKFIEDAAEALASKDPYTGRFLGTLGVAGAFSFSPNKIVTSGQGGLVVTNDDQIAENIKELKDQGRPMRGTGGDDIHRSLGFNFKYTDLQAALLKCQVDFLDLRVAHLKRVYDFYRRNLSLEVSLLEFKTIKGEFPLWPEIRVSNRLKMEQFLTEKGIGFRRIWHPLSTQEPYRHQNRDFDISNQLSKEILWLPSAFTLTDEKLSKIVDALNTYKDYK